MAYIDKDGKIVYERITEPVVVQANYLAKFRDGHRVDDLISWYTGAMIWNWGTPPCSHTEIGFWLDGELWFFSSTSRKELGAKNGTRWIKATGEHGLLRNPERWLLQEKEALPLSGSNSISIRIDRANKLIGLGYSNYIKMGLEFTIPLEIWKKQELSKIIHELKKIYCSKAVHAVDTGMLVVFSPRRRYSWAKKHGYKDIKYTREYCKKGLKLRVG